MWSFGWGRTSRAGYKVLWLRPYGVQLEITGRRLDGDALPLTAIIPAGTPTRFRLRVSASRQPAAGKSTLAPAALA